MYQRRPAALCNHKTENGVGVMESHLMFLDCPAYMDDHGAARCGLPAEVKDRYRVSSSGGQLESARIRCPRGHWFNGTIELLSWEKRPDAALDRAAGPGPDGTARSRLAKAAGLPRND